MTRTESIPELQKIAAQVRRDIIRMVFNVQSGHPGGSLGCADFFTCLYFNILRHDPAKWDMDGKDQDVFILSNGHISPVWYSVLARSGYFPVSELGTFRKLNTRLQGHPATHEGLPGIRVASGSLGQGMSVAIGAALAKRLSGDSKLVYSLHGDGELNEGQIWEAAMFAVHHKVDNLISVVDWNGQQIDGPVKKVMDTGNLHDKFSAFGWQVLEMKGHDMADILRGMKEAASLCGKGRPVMVLMHTDMGHGVDFMAGTHEWHGKAPNKEQFERAMAQLPETLSDF